MQAKEIVKPCAVIGYEEVDVAGFSFVRKRKLEESAQPSPAQKQQALLTETDELLLSTTAGAVELPGPQPARQSVAEAVNQLVRCVPAGCSRAVQVQWLVQNTLRVAANYLQQTRSSDPAVSSPTAHDIQGRFNTLLQRHVSASQQLLQGAPQELQEFEALPPFIKELCQGDKLASSLQHQLNKLQEEEAAWKQVEQKYCELQHQPAQEDSVSEDQAILPTTPSAAHVAQLPVAQKRADMQLTFQIEALCSTLEKAEVLVQQAEEVSVQLQAEYHKESFQGYAHVNSPAWLIKHLSQGHRASQEILGSEN